MSEPLETEEKKQSSETGRYPGDLVFGWTDHPKAGLIFIVVLAVLGAGLFAVDFTIARHEYFYIAEYKGFYALFGFLALGLIVLSGWPLRRMLGRPEAFYEPEDKADD